MTLHTWESSWDSRLLLDDHGWDEGLLPFMILIPIMWDGEVGHSIEDADDWKDDVFYTSSLEEASKLATRLFGSAEERGWEIEAL